MHPTSKPFPGFSSCFELVEAGGSQHFRASLDLSIDPYLLTRGELVVLEPIRASWMMGRSAPVDFIHTGHAIPMLVSKKVVTLLEENDFTGWKTYPIELSGKSGERIPDYQGISFCGRCGPIDESRTIQYMKQYPGGIFPAWRGIFFDPDSWDGSDFFMPQGHVGWIFVVEAVKLAFEKSKIKNVVFVPLDQVERARLASDSTS